jgi:hypothetical protein
VPNLSLDPLSCARLSIETEHGIHHVPHRPPCTHCACSQARSLVKENTLPFEGFVEALCRAAVLKAWPTDDEVADSECADAGALVRRMLTDDKDGHRSLCETRAVPWGSEPMLPVVRCVENLILLIVHTARAQAFLGPTKRGAQPEITPSDAKVRAAWR